MNYKLYNDYELIYMVRENDDSSRDILFEKYKPIIKSIASEFYNKYSDYGYDFDDFLQEGYIYFQKALCKYDENKECLFYTFVILCLRRGFLSFCRRITCSSKNIAYSDIVDIDEYSYIDNSSDVEMIALDKEYDIKIKELLFSLPFEIANVFELRINNFTYNEIGELLEIPISTVNFRCKKVKKAMNMFIDSYCYEKAK